ncbi:MAG: helix-hairpin-helix domain-containing protein, partial [Phototrophicaceae bacterium]|jgi:competence protein ComEA
MTDYTDPERPLSAWTTIAAFVVVVLAIVGAGTLLWITQPEPVTIAIQAPIPTLTPLPSATPAPLQVYVTGAVATPQTLVILPRGSRVQQAIDAAGGALPNADLVRVNPADLLNDGAQVHVPYVAELEAEVGAGVVDAALSTAQEAELPTPIGGLRVNINTATLQELMTLPGIGEVTASRILAERDARGRFNTLAELDDVQGIGAATLENLAPLVTFE